MWKCHRDGTISKVGSTIQQNLCLSAQISYPGFIHQRALDKAMEKKNWCVRVHLSSPKCTVGWKPTSSVLFKYQVIFSCLSLSCLKNCLSPPFLLQMQLLTLGLRELQVTPAILAASLSHRQVTGQLCLSSELQHQDHSVVSTWVASM